MWRHSDRHFAFKISLFNWYVNRLNKEIAININ